MKFAYTIVYVADVASSLAFLKRHSASRAAFSPGRRLWRAGYRQYHAVFASKALALSNHPAGFRFADDGALPLGVEIALATDDVMAAHQAALAAGAASWPHHKSNPGARRCLSCAARTACCWSCAARLHLNKTRNLAPAMLPAAAARLMPSPQDQCPRSPCPCLDLKRRPQPRSIRPSKCFNESDDT
jgi:hypothetical protein